MTFAALVVPWYVAYANYLVPIIVTILLAFPVAWGSIVLKTFNGHVKDTRIRAAAIELAKEADKLLGDKSDDDKRAHVLAGLMTHFGVSVERASQAAEAAVYDIHDAVHQIATASIEPMELKAMEPLVDKEELAQTVADKVVQALPGAMPAIPSLLSPTGTVLPPSGVEQLPISLPSPLPPVSSAPPPPPVP